MTARLLPFFILALCMPGRGPVMAQEGQIDFATQVKPILGARCVGCHKSEALFGNLNLESRALAFKKRPAGPVILPGKPDSSPLFYVLNLSKKDPKAMPPDRHRLPESEARIIYEWIKQGAVWPKGPEGAVQQILPPKKSP